VCVGKILHRLSSDLSTRACVCVRDCLSCKLLSLGIRRLEFRGLDVTGSCPCATVSLALCKCLIRVVTWKKQTAVFCSGRLASKGYSTHTMPCRVAKDLDCVFPIWITARPIWFTYTVPCPCRAPTMSPCKRLLKDTTQWVNIGRLSTTCGRCSQIRVFPTTTGSFRIGSSDFSGYTRTFTKDTSLSENGRCTTRHGKGTSQYMWFSL
jgi:hypothetical protein